MSAVVLTADPPTASPSRIECARDLDVFGMVSVPLRHELLVRLGDINLPLTIDVSARFTL
jgi:hypothetical protein